MFAESIEVHTEPHRLAHDKEQHMGIFGGSSKKSREERTQEGLAKAEQVVQGRGLTGKLAKSFMGAEAVSALGQATVAARQGGMAQQLLAAGYPTTAAVVVSVADTGQLVNFDPVVDITLDANGQQIQLQTLVSKLQIPRPGDNALLLADPNAPGSFLWGGLAQ